MILRRIVARSTAEALRRVERELGKDAWIVETRHEGGRTTVLARRPDAPRRPAAPEEPLPEPLRRAPKAFAALARGLVARGLSPRVVDVLWRAVEGLDPLLLRPDNPALPAVLVRGLAGLIPCRGTTAPLGRGAVLVGPTGVGTTTTLAKLAARAVLDEGRRPGIVCLDSFRVGATEQLRAYAELMDLPMRVAFTAEDLRRAIAEPADRGPVLVDTTGRSPRDAEALARLAATLRGLDLEVQLCVPAAARRGPRARRRGFAALRPAALGITKWDETEAPGEALGFAIEKGLPVAWVADGQRVPEDLRQARAGDLARGLCLGEDAPA
ncbi:MAG: hypothetical protein R3F30_09620 [Planctomycetota bacterium]